MVDIKIMTKQYAHITKAQRQQDARILKMASKKIGIYFAEESLELLSLIQDSYDDGNTSISAATNLAIQFCKIAISKPLDLKPGELLLCCDVLNGGAHLTEFKAPSDVSILEALDSMKFSIVDTWSYEPQLFEKWDVDTDSFYEKLDSLGEIELFTLAMATRHFWSKTTIKGKKGISECGGYTDWAKQWCAAS